MSHFVAYILQFQEIIVYKIPPGGGGGSIASLRSITEGWKMSFFSKRLGAATKESWTWKFHIVLLHLNQTLSQVSLIKHKRLLAEFWNVTQKTLAQGLLVVLLSKFQKLHGLSGCSFKAYPRLQPYAITIPTFKNGFDFILNLN